MILNILSTCASRFVQRANGLLAAFILFLCLSSMLSAGVQKIQFFRLGGQGAFSQFSLADKQVSFNIETSSGVQPIRMQAGWATMPMERASSSTFTLFSYIGQTSKRKTLLEGAVPQEWSHVLVVIILNETTNVLSVLAVVNVGFDALASNTMKFVNISKTRVFSPYLPYSGQGASLAPGAQSEPLQLGIPGNDSVMYYMQVWGANGLSSSASYAFDPTIRYVTFLDSMSYSSSVVGGYTSRDTDRAFVSILNLPPPPPPGIIIPGITFPLPLIGQSIHFPNPGSKVFGVEPFALGASSTSGLPITYTVISGPAEVSGSILKIKGVGVVSVRASQAGNETYSAAADVQVDFTVNKKPQSIVFPAPVEPVFRGTPMVITLSATSSSGLPVTYKLISGPATLNGNTLTIIGSGKVTVQADQPGTP